jgi:hypothetical protein
MTVILKIVVFAIFLALLLLGVLRVLSDLFARVPPDSLPGLGHPDEHEAQRDQSDVLSSR